MNRVPQVCGVAAIGFAVMIVLANVIAVPAGLPMPGADPGDFFGDADGVLGISSALTPLAWVLSTVFGAGAVAVLGRDMWTMAGFAGVVMQNATFAGVVAIRLALGATTKPGEQASAGLWALHDAVFTLNGTFLALALLGLSLGGRHVIARWHAMLGLVAAALLFASATVTPVIVDRGGPLGLLGLAGWLMWVVWLVTYGITLFRLRESPGRAEAD